MTAPRRDEARRRGDGHETRDRAARRADRAELLVMDVLRQDPGHGRCRGRGVGGHERRGRERAGRECRTGVEAEPAEPQQTRTEDGHGHVVRIHLLVARPALADDECDDECGDAGRDVDDGATREVKRAHLVQPATGRPDHVGQRRVDEERPEEREYHERAEALALGEGPRDEARRDGREHQLEGGEQDERDGRAVGRVGCSTDIHEAGVVEPANELVAVREGQREPDQDPHDADERQAEEAVHDGRQHVLATDETAVEQRQARQHQHHQGRGDRAARRYPRRSDLTSHSLRSDRYEKPPVSTYAVASAWPRCCPASAPGGFEESRNSVARVSGSIGPFGRGVALDPS